MDAKWAGEKPVTMLITRWEREIILRYGCPFGDIKRQLKEAGDAEYVRVTDDLFWWERMIGGLRISGKGNPTDTTLLASLEALIDRIANHLERLKPGEGRTPPEGLSWRWG